ncbi:MAG: hypothetical protein EA342_11085 [Leptolyngbya sp. LCM1.Bin17]|nr:MAG: hypothetical protein EA342_11085 [Leptolyngbya sp. LCM1.Bin17]
MSNLERGKGQASATQVHVYNLAKNMEQLESRRKQVDDFLNVKKISSRFKAISMTLACLQ